MDSVDRVAIITGASSGIGRALAKELACQGPAPCKVGLIARRQAELDSLRDEIQQAGGVAGSAPADVGDRQQVHQAIAHLTETLGPVDLLVAGAGIGATSRSETFDIEEVETLYRINLFGVLHAFDAVLPAMLERGQGHLAAISSLGAYSRLPGFIGYTSSKAALNHFLAGLRLKLRARGITVTTINPGFVRTAMTASHPFKMPWLMEPEEAARRIARALARGKKVYNFPWQASVLMKAVGWLPEWLVARLARGYEPAE
jgi:short-subunit dehydrogenase